MAQQQETIISSVQSLYSEDEETVIHLWSNGSISFHQGIATEATEQDYQQEVYITEPALIQALLRLLQQQ